MNAEQIEAIGKLRQARSNVKAAHRIYMSAPVSFLGFAQRDAREYLSRALEEESDAIEQAFELGVDDHGEFEK